MTSKRAGNILTRPENDIAPLGESQGMNCASRLRCARIIMHPHSRKIMPESRLEKIAGCLVERLTRGAKDLLHDWWRGGPIECCRAAGFLARKLLVGLFVVLLLLLLFRT